jgi:hypothetical protein
MSCTRPTLATKEIGNIRYEMSEAQRGDTALTWDMLALISSHESRSCTLLFAQGGTTEVTSLLLPMPAPEVLDELQLANVEEYCAWFTDWSRRVVGALSGPRSLIIKVDNEQSWILRVPFTLFVRRLCSGFQFYESISWIVTDRSFLEVIQNRKALHNLLADSARLLKGTVVILNTYQHHLEAVDAELVASGVSAVEIILRQLQNVPFEDGCHSLRWLKNPSSNEVMQVLLSPNTRVVIAAFESGTGKWELGQSSPFLARQYFDLALLKGNLQHVQLMRVFHCYSIYDPFTAATTGTLPADHTSIARQLLAAQAQFVEGAIMEETYLEFLAFLIQFLIFGSMEFILRGRAARGDFAWQEVQQSLNQVLAVQEFKNRVEG